jgi:3-hydroxyacyl-[acyl-carrier-protein] dehydratase
MKDVLFIEDIKSILPHRYPFLLVDRVVDIVAGESGTGIKNVTANEEYFNGHFPGVSVMPGVLILEAMAQTAILVGSRARPDAEQGKLVFLAGVEEAKFKNKVIPGDQLAIKVLKIAKKGSFEKWKASAYVGDTLCATAILSAMCGS